MRDGQAALFRRFEGQGRDFRTLLRREVFFSSSSLGVLQPRQDQAFVPGGPQGFVGFFPGSVSLGEAVSPPTDEMDFEVILSRDAFVGTSGRGGEHDLKALFHELRHGTFAVNFL